MRVEPAHVDQIRMANDGRVVLIDADVGGVAEDLRRLDPHLKVRFSETGRFWAVYWESDDQRQTYLVTTAKAYRTASGTWAGLDQRIVRRLEEIDGHNGYNYAAELEKTTLQVEAERHRKFRERIEASAEVAAHAIRKDLGVRYKGRTFIPRDV